MASSDLFVLLLFISVAVWRQILEGIALSRSARAQRFSAAKQSSEVAARIWTTREVETRGLMPGRRCQPNVSMAVAGDGVALCATRRQQLLGWRGKTVLGTTGPGCGACGKPIRTESVNHVSGQHLYPCEPAGRTIFATARGISAM